MSSMSNYISSPLPLLDGLVTNKKVSAGENLSLLCWNLWFATFAYDIRMAMVNDIIGDLLPDIVCLQEVLPQYIPMLKEQLWSDQYSMSDSGTGGSVDPYGVLILVKKKLSPTFSFYDMPTEMGRRLVTAVIPCRTDTLVIGGVHLESLKYHSTRMAQLEVCARVLKAHKNAILCGDFNFCSYRNFSGDGELENNCLASILPEYTDAWPALHPDDKGYTFDSAVNPVIHKYERMRYDRVLHRLDDRQVVAHSIALEGVVSAAEQRGLYPEQTADATPVDPYSTPKKKIPIIVRASKGGELSNEDLAEVFPSDHFGLLAVFNVLPSVDGSSPAIGSSVDHLA